MFIRDNFNTFLTEEDYNELRAAGLTAQEILQCGHFSITDAKEGKRITGIKHRGLVFRYLDPVSGTPYLTSQGKPFYRMKPRDWSETMRDWHEEPPKYLSPPKEGNRPYWSPLIQSFNKKSKAVSIPLEIVEGEKKADSLAAEGYFVLGLSGVWGWLDKSGRTGETDIPPAQLMEDEKEEQDKLGKLEESRLLPELIDQIEWRHRRVNIAFDSDLWQKTGVREAAKALASSLKELGAIPHIVRLPNECDGEKNGADDFKVRHGIGAYKALCKIAQPLRIVKNKQPSIPSEPAPLGKVFMAWSVLKDEWRFRPSVGWYKWTGQFWEKRSDAEFEQAVVYFQDAQDWMCTKGIDTLIRQLRSRLLQKEESWNPQQYLVFDNGVLDLLTNQFSEDHQREINNTSILPYPYDADAKCPTWLQFLHEALQGDTEAIALLQAFIKWILVPKPKDRKAEVEKALDLIGPKGTGKGTFLDVLTSLVGPANHGAIGSNTFKSDNGLTALLDKKVSIDYDAFGYLADVGLFNKVVSNEPVPIKFLYKDTSEARLGTVIVRAYNRVLEVPDGSEGLDRRIIAVSFNHKPTAVDLELPEKLQREMPGIFQWAWSVPMPEVKRRLTWAGSIPSVVEASVQRFEANNPEYCFLRDYAPDGVESIQASDLYTAYTEWCKHEGHSAKKSRKFSTIIQDLGCKSSGKSTGGRYYYQIPRMRDFDVVSFMGLSREISTTEFQKSFDPQLSTLSTNPEPERVSLSTQYSTALSTDPQLSTCNNNEQLRVDYRGENEASGLSSGLSSGQSNPVPERVSGLSGQSEPKTFLKTHSENSSIGLGDWVRYRKSAPEGALKVSCGSRKLQVLEFRQKSEAIEALCKAQKWFEGCWINLSYLQFVEHGQLQGFAQCEDEVLEELEQEHQWRVGDRCQSKWGTPVDGEVKEVNGNLVRVLFDDTASDSEGCWVDSDELRVIAQPELVREKS